MPRHGHLLSSADDRPGPEEASPLDRSDDRFHPGGAGAAWPKRVTMQGSSRKNDVDASSPKDLHYYEPRNGHGLRHDPFNAIIAPRPIGWISSRDAKGNVNFAPYNFFNGFCYTS